MGMSTRQFQVLGAKLGELEGANPFSNALGRESSLWLLIPALLDGVLQRVIGL